MDAHSPAARTLHGKPEAAADARIRLHRSSPQRFRGGWGSTPKPPKFLIVTLPSSAWTARGSLPSRTFPKKGLFGNLLEPRSPKTTARGRSADALQKSFSGK